MAKRKRAVNGAESEVILYGAIIAGTYFLVVKPLMNSLGGDPKDQQLVDSINSTSPDENPFSSQFQDFVDNFTQNAPGVSIEETYKSLADSYDNNELTVGTKAYNVARWGNEIDDAFSFWSGGPDVNKVFAQFAQIPNKTAVASLAAFMLYAKGKELFHFMRYGRGLPWVPNGLSIAELAQIIRTVNNLPD